MTLSNWANIAVIIQTLVVVISLWFVIRQLKQNAELAKAANAQALVALSSSLNELITQDRKVAELWVLGGRKFPEMDEVEQYRYRNVLIWWLMVQENVYLQYQSGLLREEVYKSWERDLEVLIVFQDLPSHWDNIKYPFEDRFTNYVTNLIKKWQDLKEVHPLGRNQDTP